MTFLNLLFYSRIPSQGQERGPRAFFTTNTHSLWRASTPRHHGDNKQWQKDNVLVRWSASYGNHFDRTFNSEEGRFSMFRPRDLIFYALTWFISYAKCEKSRWTLSLFLRYELETLFRKGGFWYQFPMVVLFLGLYGFLYYLTRDYVRSGASCSKHGWRLPLLKKDQNAG